ncbi:MAG: hypothetical protein HC929_15005 [Leptolyngbyaceae cyanobacterium SM2_5_2]|nr:hypothetical protein [Leptolyngbyaceae cyanobacterium SM2_5_2]
MVYFPLSRFRSQCPILQFAAVGLFTAPMLLLAPLSAEANEFARCTDGLINTGISADAASTACSRALHPDSLASCVVDVTQIPDIAPTRPWWPVPAIAAPSRWPPV